MVAVRRIEGVKDSLPDPGLARALIATVHGFPGTELLGKVPPGGAGSGNPEHARQNRPVIIVRATGLRFLGREERSNALPVLIRELEGDGLQPLQDGTAERNRLVLGPSSAVTGLGNRLMTATKGRPGKAEVNVLGWFGDGEEQPTDLRHSQGEEVCWPPFSPAVASRHVTSR
jgi:hypothetical protein